MSERARSVEPNGNPEPADDLSFAALPLVICPTSPRIWQSAGFGFVSAQEPVVDCAYGH